MTRSGDYAVFSELACTNVDDCSGHLARLQRSTGTLDVSNPGFVLRVADSVNTVVWRGKTAKFETVAVEACSCLHPAVHVIGVSGDGGRYAGELTQGRFGIADAATGAEIFAIPTPAYDDDSSDFSHNGHALVFATGDQLVPSDTDSNVDIYVLAA